MYNNDVVGTLMLLAVMTIGVLIFAVLFTLLLAIPATMLWNVIVPTIFGLGKITYWKMVGLMVLLRLLLPSNVSVNKKA